MNVRITRLVVGALLAAVTATAATAQEPSAGGPSEIIERYQNWTLRCVADAENAQARKCEVGQTLSAPNGAVVAQIAIAAVKGEAVAEDAVVIVFQVPEGVLLTAPVALAQDAEAEAAITAPYFTCIRGSCLARGSATTADLIALADEADQLALRFIDRGGQKLAIEFSSLGLTPALARLGNDGD